MPFRTLLIFCVLLFSKAMAQVDSVAVVPVPDSTQHEQEVIVLKDPGYRLNGAYLRSFWPSLKYTVSRPAHWQRHDWIKFSAVTAGVGTLLAADWEIRNIVQHNKGHAGDKVASTLEPFGNSYGVYLMPAMYLAGVIAKQPKLESAGLMGVKSLAISTLVYTATKKLVRRNRPDVAASSFDYAAPFTKAGYTSSPSGHSNTIFTVATALALEFKDVKWVPPVVYTIAGATAISRIYHNRHWSSDVLFGSLLGHFVTKAVWKSSQKKVVEYRVF